MTHIQSYFDLMQLHGCAACIYRRCSACTHPKVVDRTTDGKFDRRIMEYIENDCLLSRRVPNRPEWCPYKPESWFLSSEKVVTITKRREGLAT
jgi:hypothetical protein